MSEMKSKLLEWSLGERTGVSSQMIAIVASEEGLFGSTAMRHRSRFGDTHPCDPGDFTRCLHLVEAVPEVKGSFHLVREISDEWKAVIDNWDALALLIKDNSHSFCYDYMQKLFQTIRDRKNGKRWEPKTKQWKEYPIGTLARESWGNGGHWIKSECGWKWLNGSTFPTPGSANQVLLPTDETKEEKNGLP